MTQQRISLVGCSDVVVTLAPDHLVPKGGGSAVPRVGYLVLAPAGIPLDELFPPLTGRCGGSDTTGLTSPGTSAGSVVVDEDRRMVTVRGAQLELTYLEFELLACLVRHPHCVFTREQLISRVWSYGPVGDQRTVDVHIARLRRKLGTPYRQGIVTVRRVGYKYSPGV